MIGEKTYRVLVGYPRTSWPETAQGLNRVAKRIDDVPFCKDCVADGSYL